MTGAGFLGIAILALAVAALAYTGNLPRFIVRFITPTVTAPTAEERAADIRAQAQILTRIGQQADERERRIVHPIVVFEREKALGNATLKRIRINRKPNSDEAA